MKAAEGGSGRRRGKSDDATNDAGAPALGEHVEQLRESVAGARAAAQETAEDVGTLVRRQLDAQPYVTLGVAAGVGFVLGGGLTPGIFAAVVRHGGRMLLGRVLRDLTGPQA